MQKILLVSYFGLSVVFGPQLLAQTQPGDPDKGDEIEVYLEGEQVLFRAVAVEKAPSSSPT